MNSCQDAEAVACRLQRETSLPCHSQGSLRLELHAKQQCGCGEGLGIDSSQEMQKPIGAIPGGGQYMCFLSSGRSTSPSHIFTDISSLRPFQKRLLAELSMRKQSSPGPTFRDLLPLLEPSGRRGDVLVTTGGERSLGGLRIVSCFEGRPLALAPTVAGRLNLRLCVHVIAQGSPAEAGSCSTELSWSERAEEEVTRGSKRHVNHDTVIRRMIKRPRRPIATWLNYPHRQEQP